MAEKAVLDKLVSEGHAKYVAATVSVDVPGKTEKVKREFQKFVALDLEGCLGYCDGHTTPEFEKDEKTGVETEKRGVPSVVGWWNYAADLSQRQPIRTQVLAENEGPGKTIDKAAKTLAVALGITEDEARAQVVAARQAKGLPIE